MSFFAPKRKEFRVDDKNKILEVQIDNNDVNVFEGNISCILYYEDRPVSLIKQFKIHPQNSTIWEIPLEDEMMNDLQYELVLNLKLFVNEQSNFNDLTTIVNIY